MNYISVVNKTDMSVDMQHHALACGSEALQKFELEINIASFIKKAFDKKYSPTWHCIVGCRFGAFVTHESGCYIYYRLGDVTILLFKSG